MNTKKTDFCIKEYDIGGGKTHALYCRERLISHLSQVDAGNLAHELALANIERERTITETGG